MLVEKSSLLKFILFPLHEYTIIKKGNTTYNVLTIKAVKTTGELL